METTSHLQKEEIRKTWMDLFNSATMDTIITEKQKKEFDELLTKIYYSNKRYGLSSSFMYDLSEAVKKRPRVMRRLLTQLFPLKQFSKSIHKFGFLPEMPAMVMDYLHYTFFNPPTSKFINQFQNYVEKKHNLQSKKKPPLKKEVEITHNVARNARDIVKHYEKIYQPKQQKWHDAIVPSQQQKKQSWYDTQKISSKKSRKPIMI